jgi:integrase
LLSQGVNPKVHRRQQRLLVRFADEYTFGIVYSHWMERRQLEIKTGKRSTHAKMVRIFEKDILPFLGKQPIHEIKRLDLLEVIARIEYRGALTIARFVRSWLRQIFRYALVKVSLEYNPATDLDVVAAPRRPARHHPFLRMNELPELLQTLRAQGNTLIRQAVRLLLLTGVRTGELRHATLEQFDLERALWSIPLRTSSHCCANYAKCAIPKTCRLISCHCPRKLWTSSATCSGTPVRASAISWRIKAIRGSASATTRSTRPCTVSDTPAG